MNLEDYFKKLEKKAQENLNIIHQMNEISLELFSKIEEIFTQYKEYYGYFKTNPGQFISETQAALAIAYTKVFTVPILITNRQGVIANASGVLLSMDRKFLVTNYHVYEEWKRQNDRFEILFQVGSISIPVEDFIIDYNKSLDLITITLSEEIIQKISRVSYKHFFSPNDWPVNAEEGWIVIASGFPGKLREDGLGFSNLYHGSIVESITDTTESKYIMHFDRSQWEQVLGVKDVNQLTSLGGFSGGPVFTFTDKGINLIGVIFEDGGNFFDGIRVIRSSAINRDGTINTNWGY